MAKVSDQCQDVGVACCLLICCCVRRSLSCVLVSIGSCCASVGVPTPALIFCFHIHFGFRIARRISMGMEWLLVAFLSFALVTKVVMLMRSCLACIACCMCSGCSGFLLLSCLCCCGSAGV